MNYLQFIQKISLVLLSTIFLCHNSFADYQPKSDDIRVDSSSFSGNLSPTDNTAQKVFDTIDNLSLGGDMLKSTYDADSNGVVDTSDDKPTALSELSDDSTHRLITDSEKSTWNGKQDALVSGTNIKTINSVSLLGSGNVSLQTPLTADVDYLTPGTAASTYQPIGEYLTTESDPTVDSSAEIQTIIGAGVYAPALGVDDNYVTDAEKIVIGNTSGANTGDETQSTIKTKFG